MVAFPVGGRKGSRGGRPQESPADRTLRLGAWWLYSRRTAGPRGPRPVFDV